MEMSRWMNQRSSQSVPQHRRGFLRTGAMIISSATLPGMFNSLCETASAFGETPKSQPDITATFSIAAVDPENGICGAGVASKYPAVGKVVPYVRADVGVICTQHYHVPKWGEPALDMLQQGMRPEAVITELLKDDGDAEQRQLAVIVVMGSRVDQGNAASADCRATEPEQYHSARAIPAEPGELSRATRRPGL